MTPEERDLLDRYLSDLARSRPAVKDAEAAGRIDAALRANPDAAYVLVQHAILADHALADAQAQAADLRRQLDETRAGRGPDSADAPPSFLGALFGKGAPNPPGVGQSGPWGARGGSAVPPTSGPTAPPEPSPSYPGGAPQPRPFSGGGGLGEFLRGAGTTAAGVAGGAFLFEGLSGLFGGHRLGPGFGGGFGGGYGFGAPPVENVTINEYGDDRGGDGGGGGGYDDGDRVDYDSQDGDLAGDDYS